MLRLSTIPRRAGRRLRDYLRKATILSPFRLDLAVDVAGAGAAIENHQVLLPAQSNVPFELQPHDTAFLRVSKYFRDGLYSRSDVFVCEVPEAICHVGTGLVCTKEFKAIGDSQMAYRLRWCKPFNWFKPVRVQRLKGTYATINNTFWNYWWHWLADCLPRIYCLQKAYPNEPVVLLMPAEMGSTFKDSLASLLPENFAVRYVPSKTWLKVDRMLLPSYVTGRANGYVPAEYYEFIRRRVFSAFNLPEKHERAERIYVSRAGARYRRILNEKELVELLSEYGFKSVKPEKLSFREQVELFHKAEVVVSAHGSNWGNILFSDKIKIFVLYPDRVPNTHIFTMAKALGQEHYFLTGTEPSENSDFSVDIAAVEEVLRNEMGLAPAGQNRANG